MAEEQVTVPKFDGNEGEFRMWLFKAEVYMERFGFGEALSDVVENDLPAREGPGATDEERAAVERNRKAVSFLMTAMPNVQAINMMAAAKRDPGWPNRPKAHLMMTYMKGAFADATVLSKVEARRDLEACAMKKDENPKVLFDQLIAAQFKYAGNRRAEISDDDVVTQAIQALPAMYNSTVANLMETERIANRNVTVAALKQAVMSYYVVAMKGKSGMKAKDIEGGLVTMEDLQGDKLKRYIQESVRDCYKSNINGTQGTLTQGGATSNNKVLQGQGHGRMTNGGISPEVVMAIMQAAKKKDMSQIDTSTMLCYNCGQAGHRSNDCENPKNFELVSRVLKA
jgi:Zinc knuckle